MNFMPGLIWIFIVYFYLKLFLNIIFLRVFYQKKGMNRSRATGKLFWFRIKFDILALIVLSLCN
jgi:hypothetical protein